MPSGDELIPAFMNFFTKINFYCKMSEERKLTGGNKQPRHLLVDAKLKPIKVANAYPLHYKYEARVDILKRDGANC